MRTKYKYHLETIAVYSLWERIKYTYNNRFFCRNKWLPYIASNRDIHINNIWKDTTKQLNK